jgi:hypothetical protein
MPNWVYNGLTIEGNPESVTKLVEQMNTPFTRIHDNWDTSTMSMVKKETLYPSPVFSFWNIIAPTDLEAYNQQSTVYTKNTLGFEGNDWYNWNIRNWGVKWDVAISSDEKYPNTSIEGPIQNGDNLVVYYIFNTAWSTPLKALTNLSLQYPDLLFTLGYEEETGWGGELEILRGKFISHAQYGWKCIGCDSIRGEAIFCKECGDEICLDCGYGQLDDHVNHGLESTKIKENV